jgi:hypothetical protein
MGVTVTTTLRFASLNLWCFGTPEHRRAQERVLRGDTFELVAVQEATRAKVARIAETGGFDWLRCSLPESVRDARLGVAVLGRGLPEPVGVDQLPAEAFVNDEVYPNLARWFHERHLAVDVPVGDDRILRVGSFHATPGTSSGPGSPKLGVGAARKPWFHTILAEWVATWAGPYVFAIDANTPAVDSLDWEAGRFHVPAVNGGPGEDRLLGPPGVAAHEARDLWRVWLGQPAGRDDLAAVPEGGPLARSHHTGNRWYRYDHIWASADVTPEQMAYRYDAKVSDHALVTARLRIA